MTFIPYFTRTYDAFSPFHARFLSTHETQHIEKHYEHILLEHSHKVCHKTTYVTPAIRIRQRPGHPGSPDVLSANGSLRFGRYSEACNGRVERFLCQVQVCFRSY